MKLYIDGRLADTDRDMPLSISLTVASVTAPEQGRTGYTRSITIPMTPRNRTIMGDCEQVYARDRFNSELHTARVEVDGVTIMEGRIMLTGCSCGSDGSGSFSFNIIGYGMEWVRHAAAKGISTLFPDWSAEITPARIVGSWARDGVIVRFLPVQRDAYELINSSVGLYPPERVLSVSDYHPFLNVRKVVDEIFAEAGYEVCSDFISGEWFEKLYMSGNYPSRDVTELKKRMDFMAARFGPASAQADVYGQVYADPDMNYNTLGSIVETADPKEVRDGVALEDVFTNGGCFIAEEGRVRFVPLYEISLAFEYRLRYVTSYRIMSSSELAGFNSVNLSLDDRRNFRLTNRFKDRKKEFCAGKNFRCIAAEYAPGDTLRLSAKRITNAGADPANLAEDDYMEETIATFSSRSVLVSTSVAGKYADLRLELRTEQGSYVPYGNDWMLYDGYVEETGLTEVEITLRSKPETVSPVNYKDFSDIYFGGAESGMTMTLLEAELRPVFMPNPSEGSVVGFAHVAAHDISRFELIAALRHMFNLYFYTDNEQKKVYIEPRGKFYDGPVVDWSDRRDMSRDYVIEELSVDMPRRMTFRYAGGDAAVARHNVAEGERYGQWSADIVNPYSAVEEKVLENGVFRPSISTDNVLPSALSASIVQVGNRDADGSGYGDEYNFPPKIVLYDGMKKLPQGEIWGWPGYSGSYPYLTFHHDGGDGMTLCFEDRSGQAGLHRFWDENIDSYNTGKRLTVWLRLEPCDIEPFIAAGLLKRDFRATFRLRIDGEWSHWRLEEICDYSPAAASTRCVFIMAQ